MKCPNCGSTDIRHLVGHVWVCNDCQADFVDDSFNMIVDRLHTDTRNIRKLDRWYP